VVYVVSIAPRAERDLANLYEYIDAERSHTALNWYLGLSRAILSLENHPKRCAVTPESPELRHLLYGRKPRVYRVIFRILEKQNKVEILHIRHGRQEEFSPREPG